MTKTFTALTALLAAITLTGCAQADPTPSPVDPPAVDGAYEITGKIRLAAGDYVAQGGTCWGIDSKGPVTAGTEVIVTNSTGARLSTAALAAGRVEAGVCELAFTLAVPPGQGPYGIDVPTLGELTYSEQDLAELIDLTIG